VISCPCCHTLAIEGPHQSIPRRFPVGTHPHPHKKFCSQNKLILLHITSTKNVKKVSGKHRQSPWGIIRVTPGAESLGSTGAVLWSGHGQVVRGGQRNGALLHAPHLSPRRPGIDCVRVWRGRPVAL